MSRIFVAALIAGSTLLGAGVASAQTSQTAARVAEVQSTTAPVSVARRCSGVVCLQQVPSLGVGF